MADWDGVERRGGIQRRASKQFGGRRVADLEDLGAAFEGLPRLDKIARLRECEERIAELPPAKRLLYADLHQRCVARRWNLEVSEALDG